VLTFLEMVSFPHCEVSLIQKFTFVSQILKHGSAHMLTLYLGHELIVVCLFLAVHT